MTGGVRIAVAGALATGFALAPGPFDRLSAQEKELGASYNAELSLLFTSGNAEARTFGVGAGFRYVRERMELSLRGGGLRTETGRISRRAVGTVDDFEVVEESESELTAENYFVRSRLDQKLSEKSFVFGGAGWERNTFAGFDHRFSLAGGLGIAWVDDDRTRFKTDLGITFTAQDDVIEDPLTDDSFAGLRAAWDFWRRLTGTTSFESALVIDENLSEMEDLRADFTNAILVDINDALAFKTSFQMRFDNQPSLTAIPLEGSPSTTVETPLDELDTVLTIALVASF